MGKRWKRCQTLFFWAPESLQMVTAAMKLKDAYYGISPENFYKKVWDEAAANTGDAREAWLDGIIKDINEAYETKVAELNAASAY